MYKKNLYAQFIKNITNESSVESLELLKTAVNWNAGFQQHCLCQVQ
jgi:hypothetical protein